MGTENDPVTPEPSAKPALAPAPQPPAVQAQATPPATLDQHTLGLIKAADLANLVKKVKAGKPLSAAEREHLERSTTQAPAAPIPRAPSGRRKSAYHKATNAEIQARIETVARLMGAQLMTKIEIHKYCAENFRVHWRSADRYMVLAKKLLLERNNKSREEVRYEAILFCEEIIRSQTATVKEKADARKELNSIFGIYAPKQHQISTPPGQPAQVQDVTQYGSLPTTKLLALLAAVTADAPEEPAAEEPAQIAAPANATPTAQP